MSKVTPFHQRRGLTAHEQRERLWCGRHRRNYLAWVLVDGKRTIGRCFRCMDEEARARELAQTPLVSHE